MNAAIREGRRRSDAGALRVSPFELPFLAGRVSSPTRRSSHGPKKAEAV
jgi:hypothetical protein